LDAVIDAKQAKSFKARTHSPGFVEQASDQATVQVLGDEDSSLKAYRNRILGQDLEWFAHGTGKGTGQREDQADDFKDQNQGEGSSRHGNGWSERRGSAAGINHRRFSSMLGRAPRKNHDLPCAMKAVHASCSHTCARGSNRL
jgi:hypothetical protein